MHCNDQLILLYSSIATVKLSLSLALFQWVSDEIGKIIVIIVLCGRG